MSEAREAKQNLIVGAPELMETQVIAAKQRKNVGKNDAKALRRSGSVPAIIYGSAGEAVPVIVNTRDLIMIYRGPLGRNTPITIELETEGGSVKETVVSYRVDRNPLSLAIEHVDFLRVTNESRVRLTVPLKLTGTAPGVKVGGMLMQHISELKIEVSPQQIPQFVEVSLLNLGVNQSIKVRDMETEQFRIISQPNQMIVAVTAKGKSEDETTPGAPAGKK